MLVGILAIYLPGLGRGFISDDFGWIEKSQVANAVELVTLFTDTTDFYRPVVAVSFSLDWWLFGLEPLGYSLTNLAFLLAATLVLYRLGLGLGMQWGTALVAFGLWCLNHHGINMSLFWISGRTALLLTLFSLLAALALLRHRTISAACWSLLTMLSKEEAVLLPLILLGWEILAKPATNPPDRGWPLGYRLRAAVLEHWPLLAVLVVYLLIRLGVGGMTPFTAPAHYRFTFDPSLLAMNAFEYFIRAGTLPLASVLVLSAYAVALPKPDRHQRCGLFWARFGSLGVAA